MTSLKARLQTRALRLAREGKDHAAEPEKETLARLAALDAKLPEAGHGGRGREIAAIERSRVIAINLSAAPFEWLASHGRLETSRDKPGIGNIRFSAGLQLRDLMVGAEPAGLKSANLEGASGGGGVPVLINDFKLDCVTTLSQLRADMAAAVPLRRSKLKKRKTDEETFAEKYRSHRSEQFAILERIVYKEEWLFDGLSKRKQKAVMDQIHNGLDQVAVFFGLITPREYLGRWHSSA